MLVWYRLQKNLIIEKTFLWKWNSVTTLPGKIVTQISIAVFLRILATWFVLHIIQPSILTLRVEQYSLLSCSTILYILFPPTHFSLSHPWQQHHHWAHLRGWDCQACITTLSLLLFLGQKRWKRTVLYTAHGGTEEVMLHQILSGYELRNTVKCKQSAGMCGLPETLLFSPPVCTWGRLSWYIWWPILAYMVFFNFIGHMWETLRTIWNCIHWHLECFCKQSIRWVYVSRVCPF